MTTVIIDVDEYQNLAKAAEGLLGSLDIDITPIPDILNDCPLRRGEYTPEGLNTTVSCDLSFILEGSPTKELEARACFQTTTTTERRRS